MQITTKLHGILQDYRPPHANGRAFELSLEAGATVRSVVEQLGVPPGALYLAFLNKEQVHLDSPLEEGGSLWLFPPVAGG